MEIEWRLGAHLEELGVEGHDPRHVADAPIARKRLIKFASHLSQPVTTALVVQVSSPSYIRVVCLNGHNLGSRDEVGHAPVRRHGYSHVAGSTLQHHIRSAKLMTGTAILLNAPICLCSHQPILAQSTISLLTSPFASALCIPWLRPT